MQSAECRIENAETGARKPERRTTANVQHSTLNVQLSEERRKATDSGRDPSAPVGVTRRRSGGTMADRQPAEGRKARARRWLAAKHDGR
jgi:hypothetical protein